MKLSDRSAYPQLRRISVPVTLALAALVLFLCLSPDLGHLPLVPRADKVQHLLAYAALIGPTALLSPRDLPRTALALAVFGAGIEFLQPLVGRTQDVMDFAMNVLGLGLGATMGCAGSRLLVRPLAKSRVVVDFAWVRRKTRW